MKRFIKTVPIFITFFIFLNFSLLYSQEKSADIFQIARNGSVTELKQILKQDPLAINKTNLSGYTPLILACYNGNDQVAKYLVENDADIDLNNGYGTALMAATIKGNAALVTFLLKHKANVNLSDTNGTTALHYAVIFNLDEIAELLYKAGAKYDIKDGRGNTAKDYALLKNKTKLVTLFK